MIYFAFPSTRFGKKSQENSVDTVGSLIFGMELIEPSAREVFICWALVEREESMAQIWRNSKQRNTKCLYD